MCIILLSYRQHPRLPLVIAANRDEFYDRPAEPAHFWQEDSSVLAGKDRQGGGTWLGVTRHGRLAMLTNYREAGKFDPKATTRGKLVSDFLTGTWAAPEYLDRIQKTADSYNGFNLIIGDRTGMYYLSNRTESPKKLEPGLYGLSNHLLDTPWPKVSESKRKLQNLLQLSEIDKEAVFEILADSERAPDKELPDTGVGIELERMLSPVFIKSPNYGTRCSTFITIDNEARFLFIERTYEPEHDAWAEKRFEFDERHTL